jgi:hypothetical protein
MAGGFENTFEFLKKQCETAAQGFEESGVVRPFALPEPEEDFTEDSLISLFDRQEEEDTYSQAATSGETENIHKDMMVPAIKNDYVAGVHRDTFLRHTNRINRFVAESARRKNHAENVHEKRRKAIESFESLKMRED